MSSDKKVVVYIPMRKVETSKLSSVAELNVTRVQWSEYILFDRKEGGSK